MLCRFAPVAGMFTPTCDGSRSPKGSRAFRSRTSFVTELRQSNNCHLARLQAEFAAARIRLEPDHAVAVDLENLEYLAGRDDPDLRANRDRHARLVHGRERKARR